MQAIIHVKIDLFYSFIAQRERMMIKFLQINKFHNIKKILCNFALFQETVRNFQFGSFLEYKPSFLSSKATHFVVRPSLWNCKKKVPLTGFGGTFCCTQKLIYTVLRNSSGAKVLSIIFLCIIISPHKLKE